MVRLFITSNNILLLYLRDVVHVQLDQSLHDHATLRERD